MSKIVKYTSARPVTNTWKVWELNTQRIFVIYYKGRNILMEENIVVITNSMAWKMSAATYAE